MTTPQERGRAWEEIWRKKVQGNLQPGSGNQFNARLDVRSKAITWSCKWTAEDGFRVSRRIIQENVDATEAPGGNGSMPGLAIRLEGAGDFVVLRADDFLQLLTEPPLIAADKAANKRASARVPELFKE